MFKMLDSSDDYEIAATLNSGCIFLHCKVKNKTKSCLKLIRDSFEVILQELSLAGVDCVFSCTPNERFLKFLGKPYQVIQELHKDNKEYKVVVWEFK